MKRYLRPHHHQQGIPGRDGGAAAVRADGLRAGARICSSATCRGMRRSSSEARRPVGDVRINPFLLRLEVKGFQLEYPPGQPIRRVRPPPGRLPAVQPVAPGVDIRGRADRRARPQRRGSARRRPQSRRIHGPPGRPLHGRLLGRAAASAVALAACPASGWKAHVQRPLGPNASTTTMVAPINLEVLNLATLPDRHGRYAITAAVPDGGTITWHGDVSLLPTASAGELEVKGVKLATAWAFVRDELRLAEPRRKRRCRHALPLRVPGSPGDARAGGHPRSGLRAGAPRARAAATRSSGWTRSRRAAGDSISRLASSSCRASSWPTGSVTVIRTPDGRIALLDSFTPIGKPSRESGAPTPETRPWKVVVEAVKARDVNAGAPRPPVRAADHVRRSRRLRDGPGHHERWDDAGALRGGAPGRPGRDGRRQRDDRPELRRHRGSSRDAPGRAGATPAPARPLCHARSQVRPRIRVRPSRLPRARQGADAQWPAARSPSATCW